MKMAAWLKKRSVVLIGECTHAAVLSNIGAISREMVKTRATGRPDAAPRLKMGPRKSRERAAARQAHVIPVNSDCRIVTIDFSVDEFNAFRQLAD